jgi:hypothetical protein
MRRSNKNKVLIGVIVFIVISLIVGLTLYFVLSKKNHSNSHMPVPPAPPADNHYAEARNKLNIIYQNSTQSLQELKSQVKKANTDFENALKNTNLSIPNAVDNYIHLFDVAVDKVKSTIKQINDIYTFIGNYDDQSHSFSFNKKAFQTTVIPDFYYTIEQLYPIIDRSNVIKNEKVVNPKDYYNKISDAINKIIQRQELLNTRVKNIMTELP